MKEWLAAVGTLSGAEVPPPSFPIELAESICEHPHYMPPCSRELACDAGLQLCAVGLCLPLTLQVCQPGGRQRRIRREDMKEGEYTRTLVQGITRT